MNQYKMEPEFIVEESARMRLMEKLQDSTDRNYDSVVADLDSLLKEFLQLRDSFERITNSLQVLVQSVLEQ